MPDPAIDHLPRMPAVEPIRIYSKRVEPQVLASYLRRPFPDMIKFVADIERGVLALGGQMHVDAEELLLEAGSQQDALWGGNYLPGTGAADCIQFNSLINIRPDQENRSPEVLDGHRREKIRQIESKILGEGEPAS